jgi:hypothetical protein
VISQAVDVSYATHERLLQRIIAASSNEGDIMREAAKRWANYVSADESVGTTWKYLLASDSDLATAKGSWAALKQLGG